MPWNLADPKEYLVNQSGAATWAGAWIECSPGSLLIFFTSWTAVAATAGTLDVQATHDPLQAVAVPPDLTRVITLAATTGIWGLWPTVGVAAGSGAIVVKNPLRFMRHIYTRGGGGGANQFQSWRELRSE